MYVYFFIYIYTLTKSKSNLCFKTIFKSTIPKILYCNTSKVNKIKILNCKWNKKAVPTNKLWLFSNLPFTILYIHFSLISF